MNDPALLRDLFDRAVGLPPADRIAFLDEASGQDLALRHEVERLLAAHDRLGSVLGTADSSRNAPETSITLRPGTRLGPYEILALLGRGGMGEVYQARDPRLNRLVALKVLPARVAADRDRVERFEREAKTIAALNHPHIVTIYSIEQADQTSFLTIELVEGRSLAEVIRTSGLPLERLLTIGIAVADAVAAAHQKGITHRDLKPGNIMLGEGEQAGRVKVLDFGLAKLADSGAFPADDTRLAAAPATEEGKILGTVAYMSPEQAEGKPVDGRTDLFSLGVILYEMATGQRPFTGDTSLSIITAILRDTPDSITALNPAMPLELSRIVRRALVKDPERRYQSAKDVRNDLEELKALVDARAVAGATSGTQEAIAAAPVAAVPMKRSRRGWRIGLASSAVVALAAGTWLFTRTHPTSASEAAPQGATRRVVAVLPFKNMSANPGQDYFAAGMTEEIHGQLSKLAELRVLSREAVEPYKSGALRQLAADLGAGSIVEGSVRADGRRVRIAVELVDALTRQTLWSEEYDRQLEDIFNVQREVALRVADTLATIEPDERTRTLRPPTSNLAAYDLYLRAELLPCGDQKAIDMFDQAIQMDPSFAVAEARMSYYLSCEGSRDGDPRRLDLSLKHAREAVHIDPSLASAHMALATVLMDQGKTRDARTSFLRALALDPNSESSLFNLAEMETAVGHHDEALQWAARGFSLASPHAARYFHVGEPLLYLDDDSSSERWLLEGERRFSTNNRIQALLAMLDAVRGNLPAALVRARRLFDQEPSGAFALALVSELTYVSGSSDAELFAEKCFTKSPDVQDFWMFLASPRVRYADLFMRRGETQRSMQLASEALKHAQQAIANGNEWPRMRLEIAAIYALRRDDEQALHWLEKAYDSGLRAHRMLAINPIFAHLTRDARFEGLMSRMSSDVAEMRQRANITETLRLLSRGPADLAVARKQ